MNLKLILFQRNSRLKSLAFPFLLCATKSLISPFLTKCFGIFWGPNRLSYFDAAMNRQFRKFWRSELGIFHLRSPSFAFVVPSLFATLFTFLSPFHLLTFLFFPSFFTSLFNVFTVYFPCLVLHSFPFLPLSSNVEICLHILSFWCSRLAQISLCSADILTAMSRSWPPHVVTSFITL